MSSAHTDIENDLKRFMQQHGIRDEGRVTIDLEPDYDEEGVDVTAVFRYGDAEPWECEYRIEPLDPEEIQEPVFEISPRETYIEWVSNIEADFEGELR